MHSRPRIRPEPRKIAINAADLSTPSCRARNDEKWNKYKEDIRRAYVTQDKTLRETMQLIDLPASERKWKEKLKEWGFQKNLPAYDMAILVLKRDKRLREDAKDTTFFQNGMEIRAEKFENFKRRKIANIIQPKALTAGRFRTLCSSL